MKSKIIIFLLAMLPVLTYAQHKTTSDTLKKAQVTFIVGMHCQACKERIEKIIPMERGVKDINVVLETKKVTVTYNPQKTNIGKLRQAFIELGYTCEVKTNEK